MLNFWRQIRCINNGKCGSGVYTFPIFSNPGLVLHCVHLKYSGKQSIRMLDVQRKVKVKRGQRENILRDGYGKGLIARMCHNSSRGKFFLLKQSLIQLCFGCLSTGSKVVGIYIYLCHKRKVICLWLYTIITSIFDAK